MVHEWREASIFLRACHDTGSHTSNLPHRDPAPARASGGGDGRRAINRNVYPRCRRDRRAARALRRPCRAHHRTRNRRPPQPARLAAAAGSSRADQLPSGRGGAGVAAGERRRLAAEPTGNCRWQPVRVARVLGPAPDGHRAAPGVRRGLSWTTVRHRRHPPARRRRGPPDHRHDRQAQRRSRATADS